MTSPHNRFLSRAALAMALVTSVTVLASCGGEQKHRGMPPTPVGVTVVSPQKVPLVRDATGRLSAFRSADVRARVSGVILQRSYKEGTHVDKGQVLFKIDPAPLKATLDAAKASLAQARATYTNARINADRARKLVPKHYISKSDMDNLEAAERTAAASVKAAKAKVDSAQISLGYATVVSPIAGTAGKQQVTEGALVGQGSATLLTTVRQINPIYANFSIPVADLQRLRAEQANGKTSLVGTDQAAVKLMLADGSTYTHAGTLDFASTSVDPATGSVTLRALIPNPKQVLLPGMYAQLQVHMGTLNDTFLIPQNAVLRDANSAYVYVIGAGNKAVRKDVTTQGMQGADWIVTSGLAAGDRIVVSGIAKVKTGAEVKPTLESAKTQAKAAPAPAHTATSKTDAKPAAKPAAHS